MFGAFRKCSKLGLEVLPLLFLCFCSFDFVKLQSWVILIVVSTIQDQVLSLAGVWYDNTGTKETTTRNNMKHREIETETERETETEIETHREREGRE